MSFDSDPQTLLRKALALHQGGALSEAAALYESLLTRFPSSPLLLTYAGNLACQSGNTEESIDLFNRSLEIFPDQPLVLSNRGLALHRLNRLEDALTSLDRALALKPDYVEALFNRGNVLMDLCRFEDALVCFDHALRLRPDYVEAYNNRGSALARLHRHDEALASFEQALAIKPDHLEAHLNCGTALKNQNRLDRALASYDRVLALRPDCVTALNLRAALLQELKLYADALAGYERILALKPDHVEALNNRGTVLLELKRPDEALHCFDSALALQPNHLAVNINRANTLQELHRLDDALEIFDQILVMHPDHCDALHDRGTVLLKLNRTDEALASFDRVMALRPDDAKSLWNKALLKIQAGDYLEGWRLYEWGWQNGKRGTARTYSQKLWLGEADLAGKTLLIYPEQGLGDFIQCCRYAPLAAELGAKVLLEVPDPLVPVLATVNDHFTVVERGAKLPEFDLHCPVMSLPCAFRTTLESIPAAFPYLRVDEIVLARWRLRLGAKKRPRVGLVWAGNPSHKNDRNRSINLALLAPLLRLPLEFHSLQKPICLSDLEAVAGASLMALHHDELTDFSDTAALIEELDLVITVDTAVAHLAGALGKPVWILLPFAADYRWMLNRSDSPWYPTAKLFRQPSPGDWPSAVEEVAENLRHFV